MATSGAGLWLWQFAVASLGMTVECWQHEVAIDRARAMLTALVAGARAERLPVTVTTRYRGGSDILLLWGPGAPDRWPPMRQQIAAGGHVVALDLAYWERDHKVRLSIDAAHPQAWVMRRTLPASRFLSDRVRVADVWQPHGPVIVAGLGPKARVQYGASVIDAWERQMILDARAAGRVVFYRRKNGMGAAPPESRLALDGPIERVLSGAALVVTWHSNVAVDAIRLGIPVVCRDGAAAAIYGSTYDDRLQPVVTEVRDQFLANLAWFQWSIGEARACWRFLQECFADDVARGESVPAISA
jgi:hypothetical protein